MHAFNRAATCADAGRLVLTDALQVVSRRGEPLLLPAVSAPRRLGISAHGSGTATFGPGTRTGGGQFRAPRTGLSSDLAACCEESSPLLPRTLHPRAGSDPTHARGDALLKEVSTLHKLPSSVFYLTDPMLPNLRVLLSVGRSGRNPRPYETRRFSYGPLVHLLPFRNRGAI